MAGTMTLSSSSCASSTTASSQRHVTKQRAGASVRRAKVHARSAQRQAQRSMSMSTTKKAAGGVVCMSSSTDSNATTVEKKPGVMDNVVNDIFTRSGNEALGYMEEDSAGQSNIFAYEPAKPYESDEGAKLGTVSGAIFASITVAATLAIGYAGGKLYKSGLAASLGGSKLQSLSYYSTTIEAELGSSNAFSFFPADTSTEDAKTEPVESAQVVEITEIAEIAEATPVEAVADAPEVIVSDGVSLE